MLIVDKNEIIIKKYLKIQVLESHLIIIEMDHYCLHIKGKDLKLYYYDRFEVRIRGELILIAYDSSHL